MAPKTARNILHFPRRKPRIAVGCHADHNPQHLAFLRQHTGDAPEPIKPMRPILADIRDGVILAAFFAVVIYLSCAL